MASHRQVVLIGFAESLSAPEVTWSLVDAGFEVAAFSRRGRKSALRRSRYVKIYAITAPEVELDRATSELKTLVRNLKDASGATVGILPLDDESVWLCGRTDFAQDGTTVGARGDAVELALNKKLQIERARNARFQVPAGRCVEKAEEVFREKVEFPVVFKPALAVSKRGSALAKGRSWICADRGELENAVRSWSESGPMVLQKFLSGVGEGIFGLATENGIIAWSGHRRLRMMNPHGSGSSACELAPIVDTETKQACERFLTDSGWKGLFMIELLRDESGKLWFMELNGRCWGSMALSRRAGFEYPAWAAQSVLRPEKAIKTRPSATSPIVCRHLGRELLYLLFVMRGAKSKAIQKWPTIWQAIGEVFRLGRRDFWYNWRRDDAFVFFSDCYRTIRDQVIKPRSLP